MICASGLKKIPALATALTAYVLRILILGAVVAVCLIIYPDPGLRDSRLGYLAVLVVFYVAAWAWTQLRKSVGGAWARMAIPPTISGLMLILLVAIPAFTSNSFIYRDAFVLHLKEINRGSDKISVLCVLDINKPGEYIFTAPPSHIFDLVGIHDSESSEASPSIGVITWSTGDAPAAASTGSFEMLMEWPVPCDSTSSFAGEMMEFLPVSLEVRDGRSDNAEILINVPAIDSQS